MPTSSLPPAARIQSAVVRGLAALPPWLLRRLVGRPVLVDGQELHVEVQLALKLLQLSGEKELSELDVAGARARVAKDASTFAGLPVELPHVGDVTVPGADGSLPARLYVPGNAGEPGELLLYFHGGGFVVGDLDTHDNSCRFLARQAGVRVLAVDYRLAPEHRFPAPIDDAFAAFQHVAEHAGELGADPARIAVGGDSAGGNLAAEVAQLAAIEGGAVPAFQLLLYPWLDLASKRESYRLFREGFYLSEADLDWYRERYLSDPEDARDPRCSPVLAESLRGVAPAYLATAGFDPLRDEGEDYARLLRRAGVPVALRRHRGLIHGFFNTVAIGRTAREAMIEAAGALRVGLATRARRRPQPRAKKSPGGPRSI
jgi:acetyl esterase